MSEWYRGVWKSGERGAGYRALTALLTLGEWGYRGATRVRGWAYDKGLLRSAVPALPTLCVGNLTVGGTGKTPITAWFAGEFLRRGLRPAVVMRGYGGDEVLVHRVLNPRVPVYPSPDRRAGVQLAADAGSDSVVLDDGFQHRAIRADENVVLIAAEDWVDRPRLLPRGPWRESLAGLRRASLAVVTRKVAQDAEAEQAAVRISEMAHGLPVARAHLDLTELARFDGSTSSLVKEGVPMADFHCALAIAGVAKPHLVWEQLQAAGVRIDQRRAFPDHYRYTASDTKEINEASRSGALIATLKDAVKLGPIVGPDIELYVPVQRVVWESGGAEIETIIERLLVRRHGDSGE